MYIIVIIRQWPAPNSWDGETKEKKKIVITRQMFTKFKTKISNFKCHNSVHLHIIYHDLIYFIFVIYIFFSLKL